MVCSGRILCLSCSTMPFCPSTSRYLYRRNLRNNNNNIKWRSIASDADASAFTTSFDSESSDKTAPGFCIIEGPETVEDFAKMELQEIRDNIRSRRNKIFLHMEEAARRTKLSHMREVRGKPKPQRYQYFSNKKYEDVGDMAVHDSYDLGGLTCIAEKLVRRLRIQQRLKSAELGILTDEQENELPNFPSFIPFLPPLTSANLKQYYATCFSLIAGIMLFGGLLAPTVDPIVASFSGGAVGVISALMVVEINNVKQQEHKRCKYCLGTGYLACARCSSTAALVLIEPVSTFNGADKPLSPPNTERCPNCSGTGKVMCPTCLCTGMAMASEHDPRIDPFD